jgi:protein-S-isoprenylcysteine O-methyltransferase Ste14
MDMQSESRSGAPRRRILPLAWWVIAVIAMVSLHEHLPLVPLPGRGWTWGGGLLIAVGAAIAASAFGGFRRAGTPALPFRRSTALVTDGLYRYTRNPMYLGMVLSLLGIALLLGSLGAMLPVPFYALVVQKRFIEGEERFLEELFGEEYRAYRQRTRRWL